MSENRTCSKCNATMEQGWIPDSSATMALGFATVPAIRKLFWLPGTPDVSTKGEVKWKKGMEQGAKDISVFCCPDCGQLDFVATTPNNS